jgi:hypothetical protein
MKLSAIDKMQGQKAWEIYMFHHNEPPGPDDYRVPAEIAACLAREASAKRIGSLEWALRGVIEDSRKGFWALQNSIEVALIVLEDTE